MTPTVDRSPPNPEDAALDLLVQATEAAADGTAFRAVLRDPCRSSAWRGCARRPRLGSRSTGRSRGAVRACTAADAVGSLRHRPPWCARRRLNVLDVIRADQRRGVTGPGTSQHDRASSRPNSLLVTDPLMSRPTRPDGRSGRRRTSLLTPDLVPLRRQHDCRLRRPTAATT